MKREQFEYEKEVRAVIRQPTALVDAKATAVRVKVDLATLIDGVIVAPGAKSWYEEQIRWLLDRAELGVAVRSSSLDVEPHFVGLRSAAASAIQDIEEMCKGL